MNNNIFLLASNSAHKVNAVQRAINSLPNITGDAKLIPCVSDSGVPEQPIGFEQIAKGCWNRIHSIDVPEYPGAWKVAIENGVVEMLPGHYFDVGVVIFYKDENTQYMDISKPVFVPTDVMMCVLADSSQNTTLGAALEAVTGYKDNKDPHWYLSGYRRADILMQSVASIMRKI